ncbi:XRE family transcriptional regulator [Pseudoxanthomonas japonensis]|uniref:XRE family transcriptional regulator n=1 Tax=Pseudoxanthomonas japonensis TaxID=69284 RepID=UPI001BCB05FD|nr:XRE family transcriptional regulator [Pseudoxanthomonas japonensis]
MAETLNVEQIKGALTELGWTQRKLAEAIGVSPQTITNWMSAKDFPRPAALLKLSRALGRGFEQLVASDVPEPVIAFRRKGASKTKLEHFEKAKHMGFLLRPLVPHLAASLDLDQTIFRSPSCDYDNVQALAASRREALGLGQNVRLEYSHLVKEFGENGALLVPVIWGSSGRHENALHILLPSDNITFVYLNLDIRVEDFKFMMAHELAHIFTPALCGKDEGEDFADAFAGALLFPKELAEITHKKCGRKSANDVLAILQQAASEHQVSLFTVFTQVNAYRERYGCGLLPVDEITIHKVRNSNPAKMVSDLLWKGDVPSPELYIQTVHSQFHSSFFDALKLLLNSGSGGVGYVQQILDIPRADASAIHAVLMH